MFCLSRRKRVLREIALKICLEIGPRGVFGTLTCSKELLRSLVFSSGRPPTLTLLWKGSVHTLEWFTTGLAKRVLSIYVRKPNSEWDNSHVRVSNGVLFLKERSKKKNTRRDKLAVVRQLSSRSVSAILFFFCHWATSLAMSTVYVYLTVLSLRKKNKVATRQVTQNRKNLRCETCQGRLRCCLADGREVRVFKGELCDWLLYTCGSAFVGTPQRRHAK